MDPNAKDPYLVFSREFNLVLPKRDVSQVLCHYRRGDMLGSQVQDSYIYSGRVVASSADLRIPFIFPLLFQVMSSSEKISSDE